MSTLNPRLSAKIHVYQQHLIVPQSVFITLACDNRTKQWFQNCVSVSLRGFMLSDSWLFKRYQQYPCNMLSSSTTWSSFSVSKAVLRIIINTSYQKCCLLVASLFPYVGALFSVPIHLQKWAAGPRMEPWIFFLSKRHQESLLEMITKQSMPLYDRKVVGYLQNKQFFNKNQCF